MNKSKKTSVVKWISQIAGKKKLYIAFLIIFHIIQGMCSIGTAVALKSVVDAAVYGDKTMLNGAIAFFIGIVCAQVLIAAGIKFLDEYTLSTLENGFKSRLFSELLKKDYATVTAKHSGEWMNRLTSDAVVVADGSTHILPGLAGMLVKLIGSLVLIVLYLPKIAYIIIPGGIVLLIITYGIRKIMKRLHKFVQEADGRMRVFLQENLTSMMVVRAFAKEERTTLQAESKMEEHKNARIRRNIFSNICNIGFATVMNGVYIICVVYCCYGMLSGNITYGTLMAVMQLVGQVQSPLANISGVLPKYYAMIASAERLLEVEQFEDDFSQKNLLSLDKIKELYEHHFVSMGLSNADFAYSKEKDMVFTKFDIEFKKGEYIALTGESGCGKSTIMKILMSLYPLDKGEQYINSIDESGNVTKSTLTSEYRKLFAYVPQGNHLMSGSIRDVVAFENEEKGRKDEEIWRALKIACADEFVAELSDGIDTVLGERGAGLSEGQMQRIAIARAIFADNPIILLDEATSALDEANEAKVLKNLRMLSDKMVLIVTHRPAALEICDRIIQIK